MDEGGVPCPKTHDQILCFSGHFQPVHFGRLRSIQRLQSSPIERRVESCLRNRRARNPVGKQLLSELQNVVRIQFPRLLRRDDQSA